MVRRALDVVVDRGRAQRPRDLHAALAGGHLVRRQRGVAGPEVDRPGRDRVDAAAAPDSAVGDRDGGRALHVVRLPLGHQRRHEGAPGAAQCLARASARAVGGRGRDGRGAARTRAARARGDHRADRQRQTAAFFTLSMRTPSVVRNIVASIVEALRPGGVIRRCRGGEVAVNGPRRLRRGILSRACHGRAFSTSWPPGISIVKSANITGFSAPGAAVTYSYLVKNTGNVTLTSVGVTDPLPGQSAVTCPNPSLGSRRL